MTLLLLFSGGSESTANALSRRRAVYSGTSATPGLMVARYDKAFGALYEVDHRPANVGARWALPGGVQRLEITIRAKSRYDAYERYRNHHGQTWAVIDYFMDRPVCTGWSYEIVPDNRHVHYICSGAWKRHSDQYETDNPATAATDSAAYLKSVLTAHVPAVSSTQTQVITTSTQMGDTFAVDEILGTLPQSIIETIVNMGNNTSGDILDYWLVPNSFTSSIYPQLPLPYLRSRSTISGVADTWRVRRRDLAGISLSRHIWQLENSTTIYYTHTTTLSSGAAEDDTTLTVASITNFAAGDEIGLVLDNGRTHRTTVNGTPGGSTITLTDPVPSAAASGNVLKRTTLTATSTASDATSAANYWTRQYKESRGNFDQTQAEQYRDLHQAAYSSPTQQASFSIGSRWARKDNTKFPTWRMLMNPGYLQIDDLFPDETIGDLDGKNVFRIVGLDYDHNSRKMSVTPDSFEGDNRIDVFLQRLGLNVGQMVQRGEANYG